MKFHDECLALTEAERRPVILLEEYAGIQHAHAALVDGSGSHANVLLDCLFHTGNFYDEERDYTPEIATSERALNEPFLNGYICAFTCW